MKNPVPIGAGFFTDTGPTTAYAFMQSMGLVNDYAPDCVTRAAVALEKIQLQLPQ